MVDVQLVEVLCFPLENFLDRWQTVHRTHFVHQFSELSEPLFVTDSSAMSITLADSTVSEAPLTRSQCCNKLTMKSLVSAPFRERTELNSLLNLLKGFKQAPEKLIFFFASKKVICTDELDAIKLQTH